MGADKRGVLVTGSTAGIGRAIALVLARAGYPVAVNGRSADRVRQTITDFAALELDVLGKAADVTNSVEAQGLVEWAIERVPRFDCLVNNVGGAGDWPPSPQIEDVSDEQWMEILNQNLSSAFYCCRAVAPRLRTLGSGRIVNIASEAARHQHRSLVGRIPYVAANAGILGLTRELARQLGPFGITVNAVCPGATRGGTRTERAWATRTLEERASRLSQIPAGRLGTAEEVGQLVEFLLSDAAGYINGTAIDINGGSFMSP